MGRKKNKNILIRRGISSLLTVLLISALLLNIPIAIFAASNESEDIYSKSDRVSLDVNAAISDPLRINTSNGSEYTPTSYVYFGEVYNPLTEEYEPILCRVLDADVDNAGIEGAFFVLTEYGVVPNQNFSNYDEATMERIEYENVFSNSYVAERVNQPGVLFSSEELELIRKITKVDTAADMHGMFGYPQDNPYYYEWETDTVNDGTVDTSESAVVLDDICVFPLSAEELYKYVASYNESSNLKAEHFATKDPVDWWLRTGFSDPYGNLVGAVDRDGRVIAQSVTNTDTAGRFAFNIKKEKISYVQEVDQKTYRLAFKKDAVDNFSAEVVNFEDGVVTIEYNGAPIDTTPDNRKTNSVSVIIKNPDGEVKHYETIDTIKGVYGTCTFTLTDYSEDDELFIFWEEKSDDLKSISYTGQMHNLGCIHTFDENEICTVCGEYRSAPLIDGYYQIASKGQLFWFAEQVNGGNTEINAMLVTDITVNENVLNADGTLNGNGSSFYQWTPIGYNNNSYNGTFDGNGKTISGLYFDDKGESKVGLIGSLGVDGEVKNVGILDSYFNGAGGIGGVVGINYGIVTDCYSMNFVQGNDNNNGWHVGGGNSEGSIYDDRAYSEYGASIGGVVGENYGTVTNCYNGGTSQNNYYVGGVVGWNGGYVTNCYNEGNVQGKGYVGGVVGQNDYGTVKNCYNDGNVIGVSGAQYVGGVVGYINNGGFLLYSYNIGDVSGNDQGLNSVVEYVEDGCTIESCYYLFDSESDSDGLDGTNAKIKAQFISGEVAHLLGSSWGQNIGEDEYPVLGGTPVYKNQISGCTEDNFVYEYSNTQQDAVTTHQDTGINHICGNGCGQIVDGGCHDVNTDTDHKCDECGAENITPCVDIAPKDHNCDVCSTTTGDAHEAASGKHTCDYCGVKVTDCVPGADDGDCTTAITCSVCGAETTAANVAHTAGEDDGDCTTAVKCTECDKNAIEAKAVHADENTDGKCDTCGKDIPTTPGSELGTVEPSGTGDNPSVDATGDDEGISTGAVVGITAGSIVGVGIGGFSLFWFVIKKKKFSDLIRVFKK